MPIRILNQEALNDILLGATFLGGGGGGPVAAGQLLIEQLTGEDVPPVYLAELSDVADTALAAVAAEAGCSDPDDDAPFDFSLPPVAFEKLQEAKGTEFQYVLPVELGAADTFIPMLVAQAFGLPTLDGTAAPRSVPKLTQCTFAAAGLPISPIHLADHDLDIQLRAPDAAAGGEAMDRMLAGGVFPGLVGMACWTMTGADAKRTLLPGWTTFCEKLGALIRTNRRDGGDVLAAVCAFTRGRVLFRGKVGKLGLTNSGGLDVGTVQLIGAAGERARIYTTNENLIAYSDQSALPLAMAPDSICYLAADGTPFSNAEIADYQDQEVALVGVPAPAEMRDPKIIKAFLATLRTLDYGGAYVPLA